MKAPTSILLNPDGSVKAFGYEAIKHYGDLAEYDQHKDHYFFNKFKMNLYQQGVSQLWVFKFYWLIWLFTVLRHICNILAKLQRLARVSYI